MHILHFSKRMKSSNEQYENENPRSTNIHIFVESLSLIFKCRLQNI